jgi:SAM-dependent methyltransferase
MTFVTEPVQSSAQFDEYAENYDVALNQGLAATGEGKDYFARQRVLWLSQCLRKMTLHPKVILDYGCGTGSTANLFLELLAPESLIGVDTSSKSVALARRSLAGRAQFFHKPDFGPNEEVDLAYCNGVFHHIPPNERARELDYIRRSLRPGGLFAFWENNPWNPGTRYVMSRIPFDRDAIMLPANEARTWLRKSGFKILRTDFLFFFPRFLRFLRPVEAWLSNIPLGGQYQILCRRP